ncbi:hypothetical protein EDC94DRAFT_657454 [Helicostylum pulchrum]|nr:hypothetical protein EDC94DRAFT_657454 [Helicostylum pulchrum]
MVAVFLFNQSSNHKAFAKDALVANRMNMNAGAFEIPRTDDNQQEKNKVQFVSHAQVIQFLNITYLPSDPMNEEVYEYKSLTNSDILSMVWKYTDLFDKKTVISFGKWCANNVGFTAAHSKRRQCGSGKVSVRSLFVAKEHAASEWTLKKYQNHFSEKSPEKAKKAFMKNLEIVKNKAKNIPSDVNQHINRLMKPDVDPGTSSSRNVDNITVKGNYYHAEGDLIINKAPEKSSKKKKTLRKDKEPEKVDFKQKWIEFLADTENNRNFHRYCPEKNGVTRLGVNLSPHPHANREAYKKMKELLNPLEVTGTSIGVNSDIRSLVAASNIDGFENAIESKAIVEGEEKARQAIKSISVISMMKKNVRVPYFIPGEDELESMTIQLECMGQRSKESSVIVQTRLRDHMDLEVLILETAGAFDHDDNSKTSFGNSKGMFALLAILKTMADQYNLASVEEFSYHTRLCSMQYARNGLYNFVREKKIVLSEDFDKREEQLEPLLNFFLDLKIFLEETSYRITALKEQHEESTKHYDSENNSQIVSLSDIICPKIFKLDFNTHGQHFSEHLKSSPESV